MKMHNYIPITHAEVDAFNTIMKVVGLTKVRTRFHKFYKFIQSDLREQ